MYHNVGNGICDGRKGYEWVAQAGRNNPDLAQMSAYIIVDIYAYKNSCDSQPHFVHYRDVSKASLKHRLYAVRGRYDGL